jgi:hypothetical protein
VAIYFPQLIPSKEEDGGCCNSSVEYPSLGFVSAAKSKSCSILIAQCGFGPEGYLVEKITNGDGSTRTTTCSEPVDGKCPPCNTVCAGTVVETFIGSGSRDSSYDWGPTWYRTETGNGSVTTTITTTYNSDCSKSSDGTCSGTSTNKVTLTKSPTSTYPYQPLKIVEQCDATASWEDGVCRWTGKATTTITTEEDGEYIDSERDVIGPCVEVPLTDYTVEPEPQEQTTEYSSPTEPVETEECEEEQGTDTFPDFIECTPEGKEPTTPELEDGQGYSNTAYNYESEENSSTASQKIKYRVEHRLGSNCYLKMWIKRTTTPEDGAPTTSEEPTYEWNGTGAPCFTDGKKAFCLCENTVYGPERTVTASKGEAITIGILKYSFVKDYEPNDPDEFGDQGDKPNGFPPEETSIIDEL